MTSVNVIKDIFRREAVDLNQKKKNDCQSVRCTSFQCVLSMNQKVVEVFLCIEIVTIGQIPGKTGQDFKRNSNKAFLGFRTEKASLSKLIV